MGPVISDVVVRSMFLEVPLCDFVDLPRQLGCSLHRRRGSLVMAGERGGCSLTFDTDEVRATLTHIAIRDDDDGRFMREVVVALFLAYAGELEANLQWSPAREQPPLIIKAGETRHPLLEQAEQPLALDVSYAMIEQWQSDGRAAWDEYQRLKQDNDAST
jgi:hypothetical protein